jgi:hypothetical protein
MKSLAPLEAAPDIAPEPPRDTPEGGTQEPQPEGGWCGHGVKYSNQTHRSTSDPEARLYRKSKGREARLSYLMHDLIDTKSRVILRRRVSAAHSSAEREIARQMLAEVLQQREALALPEAPEIASLDAGYGTGSFAADVLEMGVLPHMPLQASPAPEAIPTWKRPTRNLVQYRRRRERVRIAQARNRVRDLQQTRGYRVSRKLRIRSEHVFAEAKTIHGMDRARQRGRNKVQLQAELVGIVQNLKRLAAFRGRRGGKAVQASQPLPCAPCVPRSPRRTSLPACRRRGAAIAPVCPLSSRHPRSPIRRPPSSTAF